MLRGLLAFQMLGLCSMWLYGPVGKELSEAACHGSAPLNRSVLLISCFRRARVSSGLGTRLFILAIPPPSAAASADTCTHPHSHGPVGRCRHSVGMWAMRTVQLKQRGLIRLIKPSADCGPHRSATAGSVGCLALPGCSLLLGGLLLRCHRRLARHALGAAAYCSHCCSAGLLAGDKA